MRIGVIGPSKLVGRIVNLSEEFPSVEACAIPYSEFEEVPMLVKRSQGQLDGILFTGPIPYYAALERCDKVIPWSFVPYSSTGLLVALFNFVVLHPNLVGRPIGISIDTITRAEVHALLDDTVLAVRSLHIRNFDASPNREFVRFHSDLYKSGEADCCITCVESIYDELRQSVPTTFLITPVSSSIRGALQGLVLKMEKAQTKMLQSAVGIIVPTQLPDSIVQSEQSLISIHQALLEYAQKNSLMVIRRNDFSFQIISTLGQLLLETRNFSEKPLYRAIYEQTGFVTRLGYGIASNIKEAEIFAMEALNMSNKIRDCIYVYDGEKAICLGETSSTPLKFTEKDPYLVQMAHATGMTVGSVSRNIQAMEMLGKDFSASELSKLLGIQPKAARKILASFSKAGVLDVSGKRSRTDKGRPIRLYRLKQKIYGGEEKR